VTTAGDRQGPASSTEEERMGRMRDVLPEIRTIAEIPFVRARERGEKTALVTERGESLSYAALDERTRRFAAFLRSLGPGDGERVAILLPNVPEFVVSYFGTIAAGQVAVPVNYRLSPPEVGYILADCGARVTVTTAEQYRKIAGCGESGGVATWVLIDEEIPGKAVMFAHALDRPPCAAPAAADPDDVACLMYTSGTTGYPKGAMLSHRNTMFNVDSCRAALGYRDRDIGLVSIPLFHATGLHSQLVALLACGGTVVLQREYDTRSVLELISKRKVTALFFVPAIYKLISLRKDLADYDLSSVRVAAYGGAPMDGETINALRGIFRAELHNAYGLTECTSLATVLPSRMALSRADSVGLPVPGVDAEVRGSSGEALPRGETGELFLRGPNIVKGYFRAPEKTQEAFAGGWLKTGDVARIDGDGLVCILDRVKDMINRGGEKIFGLEVENVLYAFPGVAEAAIVGVPHPVFGEVPVAFMVPMPGEWIDPDKVRDFCRTRLADFKIPVEVRLTDKLPRNPGGKVVKQQLKRLWMENERKTTPAERVIGIE
jgi:long-chain acyl-CoA synthetase